MLKYSLVIGSEKERLNALNKKADIYILLTEKMSTGSLIKVVAILILI